MTRRWVGSVAVLGIVAMVCGCGQGGERGPATRTVQRFITAAGSGQGGVACSLLTGPARQAVTGATHVSCAAVITSLHIAGAVRDAQVWGDTAQIHLGSGVVFLRHLDAGWRISAFSCAPESDGRYDCDIQG